MTFNRRLVLFPIFLGFLACLFYPRPFAYCFEEKSQGIVGILISREIRPFIEMVEGLESELALPSCRIFFDSKGTPYSADSRFKGFEHGSLKAVVAVGPKALEYLVKIKWKGIFVYAMVLSPERILEDYQGACGLPLQLSYPEYFLNIRSVLPSIRYLGVLFDPQNNQIWFDKGKGIAAVQGLVLVPLTVKSRSDISFLFQRPRLGVDAIMFIPDRTVISKAIIEFVIKESLFRGIPVIGYNKFFHESGAAVSFVIDYRAMGIRAAKQVENLINGNPCRDYSPPFKIFVNTRVIEKLNLKLGKSLPANLVKD